MRFLADMGVSIIVCDWLRAAGHDVTHLRDERLQRLPNGEIFLKAAQEQRVLLTFDLDFGEILAGSGGETVSVAVFRLRNSRTAHVIDRLGTVLDLSAAALTDGAIIVVEDGRHRVRRLPLGE
jgi:predicted nuclease of predicted toxin-antitoxin system